MARRAAVSRRSYLVTVGTAVVGGVAGCLDVPSESVRVLAAGSLARAIDDHVGPAFENEAEITVHGEYYGTNAVVRMVEDRTKHPDVVVGADARLLRDRLYGEFTDWDIEFATNSLGIAYNDETSLGRQLGRGEPWYDAMREADDGNVVISDPDLDPLGYRALQAFELAERAHDIDGLREEMLDTVYMEPEEPQMLAGVETGSRAAALVYKNMAAGHGLPFVEFPDEYNFSDPDLADHYATVSYTTDGGYTATGRPILYNATVNDTADNPAAGRQFVQFLADNSGLLENAGLTVSERLPRAHGTLPEAVSV